jgi:glycine/D-amino acid oxidase-like deaminating enzyme
MTRSIWLEPEGSAPREKKKYEVDVAIIGGGMIGAGCAYYLSKRKLGSVLLEAGKLASGSTGRNAGFVLRGIQSYYNLAVKRYGKETARAVYTFAQDNQGLLREFLDQQNCPYEPCGSYLLACSLEELEDLAQSADLMHQDGFKVDYLKRDPLDRDFYGALYNADDFGIDPVRTVKALLAASEGCTVVLSESAERIQSDGNKLTVYSSTCQVECERVLITVGAYAPLFDSFFTEKILPARGQVLVTKPLRERLLASLCYANYGFEYFRQLPDNRLMLGGCRQLFKEEEVGYADIVTRPVQQALENLLKDRFPEVAGVRIDYRFSGVIDFTADGLPLVGELRKWPGTFYGLGMNGHGLGYGMNMSRLLVEVAMDGRTPGIFDGDRAPAVVAAGTRDRVG